MARKLMSVDIACKSGRTFSFNFYGDPIYLDEWRSEGLDIWEVVNTVPMWVVDLGMVRPWCFVQDIIHFKNPFRK